MLPEITVEKVSMQDYTLVEVSSYIHVYILISQVTMSYLSGKLMKLHYLCDPGPCIGCSAQGFLNSIVSIAQDGLTIAQFWLGGVVCHESLAAANMHKSSINLSLIIDYSDSKKR